MRPTTRRRIVSALDRLGPAAETVPEIAEVVSSLRAVLDAHPEPDTTDADVDALLAELRDLADLLGSTDQDRETLGADRVRLYGRLREPDADGKPRCPQAAIAAAAGVSEPAVIQALRKARSA